MNEKEIIRRCQNGDKSAFDELIRTFYPYVTKYLLKLTHDENLTEDLTQEVFLKVIRTIEEYRTDGRASFATYVITIAKNTFIDYTRRNRTVFSDLSETEAKDGENPDTVFRFAKKDEFMLNAVFAELFRQRETYSARNAERR